MNWCYEQDNLKNEKNETPYDPLYEKVVIFRSFATDPSPESILTCCELEA